MKKMLLVMAFLAAFVLMVTGCPTGAGDDPPPDPGKETLVLFENGQWNAALKNAKVTVAENAVSVPNGTEIPVEDGGFALFEENGQVIYDFRFDPIDVSMYTKIIFEYDGFIPTIFGGVYGKHPSLYKPPYDPDTGLNAQGDPEPDGCKFTYGPVNDYYPLPFDELAATVEIGFLQCEKQDWPQPPPYLDIMKSLQWFDGFYVSNLTSIIKVTKIYLSGGEIQPPPPPVDVSEVVKHGLNPMMTGEGADLVEMLEIGGVPTMKLHPLTSGGDSGAFKFFVQFEEPFDIYGFGEISVTFAAENGAGEGAINIALEVETEAGGSQMTQLSRNAAYDAGTVALNFKDDYQSWKGPELYLNGFNCTGFELYCNIPAESLLITEIKFAGSTPAWPGDPYNDGLNPDASVVLADIVKIANPAITVGGAQADFVKLDGTVPALRLKPNLDIPEYRLTIRFNPGISITPENSRFVMSWDTSGSQSTTAFVISFLPNANNEGGKEMYDSWGQEKTMSCAVPESVTSLSRIELYSDNMNFLNLYIKEMKLEGVIVSDIPPVLFENGSWAESLANVTVKTGGGADIPDAGGKYVLTGDTNFNIRFDPADVSAYSKLVVEYDEEPAAIGYYATGVVYSADSKGGGMQHNCGWGNLLNGPDIVYNFNAFINADYDPEAEGFNTAAFSGFSVGINNSGFIVTVTKIYLD
ncbi:MAG: hypothetical protein FWH38_02890 [Treponema sp.]|nr:hypothetical protein [Treponema sp.]